MNLTKNNKFHGDNSSNVYSIEFIEIKLHNFL